jgi:putative ABC transport system permease protein
MGILSAIRVALDALLVNKVRSTLTSLGIVIGISAVIALVAAGSGARHKLDERLDSIGKNLILVRPGAHTQQGAVADFRPLSTNDASAIRKDIGPLLVGAAEVQVTKRLAASRNGNWGTVIVGSVPAIQQVRNWSVQQGRFYNEDDIKKVASVCLLGKTVREKLFPYTPNPVGEMIRIDNVQLRVIGVLDEKGRSATGADQDDQIFVPLVTLQRKLGGSDPVGMIVVAVRPEVPLEKAKEAILKIMRERHHIKNGQTDDFDVSSVQEMAELAVILTTTLQLLTAIIASISLVVGGIGIMNIMLVSVTERTREIGIRMAVGATPFDVLVQFLIEAIVLSLVGGLIGISLGILAAVAIARLADWPLVIAPTAVMIAFAVAAAVGIFFGYYPALKASRLDPIEALRYE